MEIVVKPFFKWPGSKVWLVQRIFQYLKPYQRSRIVEPFGGSAAFFLGCGSSLALLADTNKKVVDCLQAVRDDPSKVIFYLQSLSNDRGVYSVMRDYEPHDIYTSAARLIYLTNTSWGGLYRENRFGKFNVPFGNNGRRFFCAESIYTASARLSEAVIINCGYSETLAGVGSDDLVFVDAPYVTKRIAEYFDRYHASRFNWDDQVTLAKMLTTKANAGVSVLVTCAADADLYALFPGWTIFEFAKRNSMAAMHVNGYRNEALLLSPALNRLACCLDSEAIGKKVIV